MFLYLNFCEGKSIMEDNAKHIYEICILWALIGIYIVTVLSGYFSTAPSAAKAEIQHISS
jgi:hypothetical protein